MDLFDYSLEAQLKEGAPLADRMRPRTLDEFIGQSHILSAGRLLRRAIQADQLSSLIFYGPPGTGKTTLARIIANTTQAEFISLNAVLSGVKNIRESIAEAEKSRKEYRRKTILFIDEVHRFNKAQQDALLPHVENGIIILIGATTENPYFEVNKALVSRSRIFQLKPLNENDLAEILMSALNDKERGFGNQNVSIGKDAADHLTRVANGDARAVLNALELAVITSEPDKENRIHIELTTAEESIQQKAILYDKDGDVHFDTISAFIKSLRGSDPDAALYWMAKMVYGGEDPRFIFRRLIIFAAEDIGMADPNALQVVMSAAKAYDYVGMPEGRFHMAEACIYLSTAPKSNSGFAFFDALDTVKKEQDSDIPDPLKDASRDKEGFGHGEGYLYPHAYKDHWVAQQYLPTPLQGRVFYQPSDQGYEQKIAGEVARNREVQLAASLETPDSKSDNGTEYWQGRTMGNTTELLTRIREHLFNYLSPQRDNIILNLNAGSGFLTGEALRQVPDGTVYAQVNSEHEKSILENQYGTLDLLSRPIIQQIVPKEKFLDLSFFSQQNIQFDAIIGRNCCGGYQDKQAMLEQVYRVILKKGCLVMAENLPVYGQRLSEYLPENRLSTSLRKKILAAEDQIYLDQTNLKTSWNDQTLLENIKSAGFKIEKQLITEFKNETLIAPSRFKKWFSMENNNQQSYANYLKKELTTGEIDLVMKLLKNEMEGNVIQWKTTWIFVKAIVD